jgi:hypothetical protein
MSEGIGPTTEERCPKHGAVIVKPPNSEPFCWPCSQPPAPDSLAPVEVGQTVATADTLNLDWHAPSEGAPSEADAMTPGAEAAEGAEGADGFEAFARDALLRSTSRSEFAAVVFPIDERRPPTVEWPRHYRCYVCDRLGMRVRATLRAFSGQYADGWPACDMHHGQAIADALRPLSDPKTGDGYTVRAYRVTATESGDWQMGHEPLWEVGKPQRSTPLIQHRDPKPSNTTLAIGSTWTGPDGTVYDVVAPELAARLVELGRLPDDWGGSEKPSSRTLEVAAYLLSRMAIRGHTEARLAPMADGGIAVRYLEGPRSARFDVCNEEGAIVLATREVGAERQVFAEMLAIDAIDAMVRFLAQPPASELDTLRGRVGELEGEVERAGSIAALAIALERHDVQAFVVQRHLGQWRASVRTSKGVGPRDDKAMADEAIGGLLAALEGARLRDSTTDVESLRFALGEAQSQLASAIAACEASRKARDEAVVDTERLEVQLDALTVHFGSIAASISRIVREHIVRTTGAEPALEGLGRIELALVEGGKAREEVKRLKAQRAHAVGIVDQRDRELFDASRPDVDSLWVHRKTGRTVLVEMYGTEYQLRYRYLGGSRKSAWLNATTFHERFERKPKPAKRKAGR